MGIIKIKDLRFKIYELRIIKILDLFLNLKSIFLNLLSPSSEQPNIIV